MRRLALIGLVTTAMVLSACGGDDSPTETEPTDGSDSVGEADDGDDPDAAPVASDGTLTLGMNFAHTTLDPDLLPIQHMWTYLDPLYDSLTWLDGDEVPQPRLAESWEFSEDDQGDFLEMTLQSGLTFPDGTEFNTDAVVANVQRSVELEGSTNAPWLAAVEVEAIDDTTLRFRSESGVGQLPRVLAGPAGSMISPSAIEANTDLSEESAGIAPFSLVRNEQNRVVYEANGDYWNPDDAAVENLEIVYMADDAMLNAVRAGDVDVTVLPVRMQSAVEEAGYVTESGPGDHGTFYVVNTAMAPFDDPQVREAVSMSIDREGFCESIWDGQCQTSGQFFGPNRPFYDEDLGLSDAQFDIDEATSLIEQTGAAGASFEILTVAGIEWQEDIANYVSEQLRSIGLDPTVTALPPPQVVGRFAIEQNAAMTIGSSGLAFDPSIEVARYLLPGGLYNVAELENASVSDLAAEGLRETDSDARNEIYAEISGLINEDRMIIPIVAQQKIFYMSPAVTNWTEPWGWQFITMRGIGLDS